MQSDEDPDGTQPMQDEEADIDAHIRKLGAQEESVRQASSSAGVGNPGVLATKSSAA